MTQKTIRPVTVSLADLQSGQVPFSSLLEAFGPSSLGILVVSDLPASFQQSRKAVLSNSSRLASLPAPALETLTNPTAKYLVGWSHGKESLRPGVVDTYKGSYYINCAFYKDPALQGVRNPERHPGFDEYTAENIWPTDQQVSGFKDNAEGLIRLIIDTAVLVARACDRYAESEIQSYPPGYLEKMVKESETTKARLLHYFPNEAAAVSDDDWCATHLDHGCLTGLTSAMFLDEAAESPMEEINSPSPSAGLYIRDRHGEVHKVSIPRDCLAFQTGEALELITQGKFKAVPHFVKGVDPRECPGRIARNTLAVFTQPNLDEVVDTRTGLTFAEFARGVVKKNTTAS